MGSFNIGGGDAIVRAQSTCKDLGVEGEGFSVASFTCDFGVNRV